MWGRWIIFESLLREAELDEGGRTASLSHFPEELLGVEELVQEQKLKKSLAAAFVELPQMFGSTEVLKKSRTAYAQCQGAGGGVPSPGDL